jgi:hypothetical protein
VSDPAPGPPAETDIRVSRTEGALTISVPPRGLRKGSHGLFFFSVFWNGILLLVTPAMLFGDPQGRTPVGLLFLGVFWAVGLGVLAAALKMGRRRWELERRGDRLSLVGEGPFGRRREEWRVQEIQDVQVAPSGWTVNDVPLLELRIALTQGRTVRLLRGRDEAELRWVAGLLRGEAGEAVEAAEVAHRSGGTCQVCGSELRDRVVYCARCRTAHHEECWSYAGQCSTFGCREVRFVRSRAV